MKTNINENHKSSSSQKDMILEHLMSGRPLKEGYIVYREMVTDSKTGKRYAQYSM